MNTKYISVKAEEYTLHLDVDYLFMMNAKMYDRNRNVSMDDIFRTLLVEYGFATESKGKIKYDPDIFWVTLYPSISDIKNIYVWKMIDSMGIYWDDFVHDVEPGVDY